MLLGVKGWGKGGGFAVGDTVTTLISAAYIWQRHAVGFARLPSFEFGNFLFGWGFAAISPARQVLISANFNSARMGGGVAAQGPRPHHLGSDWVAHTSDLTTRLLIF